MFIYKQHINIIYDMYGVGEDMQSHAWSGSETSHLSFFQTPTHLGPKIGGGGHGMNPPFHNL